MVTLENRGKTPEQIHENQRKKPLLRKHKAKQTPNWAQGTLHRFLRPRAADSLGQNDEEFVAGERDQQNLLNTPNSKCLFFVVSLHISFHFLFNSSFLGSSWFFCDFKVFIEVSSHGMPCCAWGVQPGQPSVKPCFNCLAHVI